MRAVKRFCWMLWHKPFGHLWKTLSMNKEGTGSWKCFFVALGSAGIFMEGNHQEKGDRR